MLVNCNQRESVDVAEHKKETEFWHVQRLNKLKAPDGWLNLAGLFWLKSGENSFGSGVTNDLVFPKGKIPEKSGVIVLKDGEVSVFPAKGIELLLSGNHFEGGKIYPVDSGTVVYLSHQSLRFTIIRRNERFGVRLRDDDMLLEKSLEGLQRYPIDIEFRAEATLIGGTENDSIDITNVLGQQIRQKSGGRFSFKLFEMDFELTTIDEGTSELFIVFGDKTTGKGTYGGGRFLYIPKPDQNGKTIIDFNRAINPPCVFTEFATCPLPPAYNKLALAIEAGEKDYHQKE